jgi:toxin ParE1/3/4
MGYEVLLTEAAAEDFDGILAYLAGDLANAQAATHFLSDLSEKLEQLRGTPLMCEYANDPLLRGRGYRKIVIGSYIVLYRVVESEQKLYIMRLFYGKRKYEDIV